MSSLPQFFEKYSKVCFLFVFSFLFFAACGCVILYLTTRIMQPIGAVSPAFAARADDLGNLLLLLWFYSGVGHIILLVVSTILSLFVRRGEYFLAALAILTVESWGTLFGLVILDDHLHARAVLGMAERAKPLVAAIERHKTEKGAYPETLQELLPDFIPAIPEPGAFLSSTYEYSRDESENQSLFAFEVRVKPFKIGAVAAYIYWPHQNYPSCPCGDSLFPERYGDWALVICDSTEVPDAAILANSK